MAFGRMSFQKIWNLFACIDFISKILSLSHDRKAFIIEMVVMTMQMRTHIVMIAVAPEPTQRIMIGPRATFGKLFKIMMYGSRICRIFSFHHSRIAIKEPRRVAIINPITVSYNVIPICPQRVPEENSVIKVLKILDGLLKKKGSIIP